MSTLQYKFITIKINEFIIYGLKNKMQAIRIFYLVGSAQCKHETYAITYIVLWYSYGGPLMQRSTACSANS